MRKVAVLLTVAMVASAGCATMFNGSSETIYVRSDEKDTVFYLDSREIGKGYAAQVKIPKRDLKGRRLTAAKEGCAPVEQTLKTRFDRTTLWGILVDWGMFSILVVDWLGTGAVNRAAQNDYVLTPACIQNQFR